MAEFSYIIRTAKGARETGNITSENYNSALEKIVLKQIERVKHYVATKDEVIAAPFIVTLYQESTKLVNRVPIVPIIQFSSFVDEFYGNLGDIRTVEK